jgi:sugar lactone lactonase YvrE
MDIAVDPDGYLFLLARHQGERAIVLLDFDGLFLGLVELQGLPLQEHPIEPISIALSPSGQRLYVLDAANHLLIIADRDGIVQTVVDLVAEMSPEDAREQLYGHVDVYADTVLVPRPTLGLVHLFDLAGSPRGHVGLYGTGSCRSAFPMAAALDADGNILVLDQRRMMFMLWDPRENRCLDEYYGLGDFPGGLYSPEDLALDGDGRVYIGQTFQGRVQVYEGARPAARP